MTASGTITLRGVTKTFAGSAAPAVAPLDLEIPGGELVVLIGPSGCGKTTTLRMINRLIEPTAGTITIDGADIRDRSATELRRGIGYVIQQVGLFPHRTVAQNIATVPRLLGWDRARTTARVAGAGRPRRARADDARRATPPSCRAASSSASGWPGPWPPTRRSC